MNSFYVSLVFFGVLLVIFSLICILFDKKKVFSFMKSYEDKKQEIVEIINDAEQMLNELNRFSDFIVNQMELKSEELSKNLRSAEEKVNALSERVKLIINETETIDIQEEVECGTPGIEASDIPNQIEQVSLTEIPELEISDVEISELEISDVEIPASIAVNGSTIDTGETVAAPYFKAGSNYAFAPAKKNEKVIPINNKYSEVIRLSQEGMHDLEIARRLNMGKGEVELILGLRK